MEDQWHCPALPLRVTSESHIRYETVQVNYIGPKSVTRRLVKYYYFILFFFVIDYSIFTICIISHIVVTLTSVLQNGLLKKCLLRCK